MSYQNYGQNQGQGGRYGQANPYAQQNVQYDPMGGRTQEQAGYGQQGEYDQQDLSGQQQGGYGQQGGYVRPQTGLAAQQEPQNYPNSDYGDQQASNAYEMGAMNGHHASQKDPNAILNACREIDRGIDSIEGSLKELTQWRGRADTDPGDESEYNKRMTNLSNEIMESYSALVGRVKKIRSDPMSGIPRNAPQVGRVKRRLEQTMRQYQQIGLDIRNQERDQIERTFRIAHPEATEDEINQAVEDPEAGRTIFATALMDRDRRGRAQTTLKANEDRHKALQKMEQSLIELAEMFQELDAMVIQQEAAVENIDQRGEDVQQNVEQANVQLDGAIQSANAARRKKFWCLGIALLIVIIIVVIVVVVVLVVRG